MTSSQVILNAANYDSSTGSFILRFAQQQRFHDQQVALPMLSIFNSFGNVSSELGNNSLTIYWPDGASHTAFPITIADGHYTAKTFFTWLQEKMDERYLYTLQSDLTTKTYSILIGENNSYQKIAFFREIAQNANQHVSATWALPTGAAASPYIVWPASLAILFGMEATTIGTGGVTNNVKSTTVGANSINSIIVTCNLINSHMSFPSNMLSSFPIGGTEFGNIFNKASPKQDWIDITQNGSFSELVIHLHDQNMKAINILDTNVTILLSFRKKK
jgi:hypothetical protein